jgi:hypothetical protein
MAGVETPGLFFHSALPHVGHPGRVIAQALGEPIAVTLLPAHASEEPICDDTDEALPCRVGQSSASPDDVRYLVGQPIELTGKSEGTLVIEDDVNLICPHALTPDSMTNWKRQ